MATFQERLDRTKRTMFSEEVTVLEAFLHLYYWILFEISVWERNNATKRADKYRERLHINLDVYDFRKDLNKS